MPHLSTVEISWYFCANQQFPMTTWHQALDTDNWHLMPSTSPASIKLQSFIELAAAAAVCKYANGAGWRQNHVKINVYWFSRLVIILRLGPRLSNRRGPFSLAKSTRDLQSLFKISLALCRVSFVFTFYWMLLKASFGIGFRLTSSLATLRRVFLEAL